MLTDLHNTDFVSFHIKPAIQDETWEWIKTQLNLNSEESGEQPPNITSDGFVSCVDLGFIRTSDGGNYSITLHPNFNDSSTAIPGNNGEYYFSSLWTTKDKNIPIAFDAMTEVQMRIITLLFAADGKLWDMYFDEAPYKVYRVKISSPIQLNAIPLQEEITHTDNILIHNHALIGENEKEDLESESESESESASESESEPELKLRYYAGTGSISLKVFKPFARERFKALDQYEEENLLEWSEASRLLPSMPEDGEYKTWDNKYISVFNAGDMPSDWNMIFKINGSLNVTISNRSLDGNIITDEDGSSHFFKIENLIKQGNDEYIRVNTQLNLIEGGQYTDNNIFVPSGLVYDKYKTSGKYFTIKRGKSKFYADVEPVFFDYTYWYL